MACRADPRANCVAGGAHLRRPNRSGQSDSGLAMSSVIDTLVPVAVIAVAIVLLLGLVNMLRGGSATRSQSLMRWRVLLQFIAIIVIMGVVWYRAT